MYRSFYNLAFSSYSSLSIIPWQHAFSINSFWTAKKESISPWKQITKIKGIQSMGHHNEALGALIGGIPTHQ